MKVICYKCRKIACEFEYSKYFCSKACEDAFKKDNEGKVVSVPLVSPIHEAPSSTPTKPAMTPDYIESLASLMSTGGGFRTVPCSCGILLPVKDVQQTIEIVCTYCGTPMTVYPVSHASL